MVPKVLGGNQFHLEGRIDIDLLKGHIDIDIDVLTPKTIGAFYAVRPVIQ